MAPSIVPPPRRKLRLGFVPLADCAPLVMAQELGLFGKYGVKVSLHRELGWATVRDKIIHGELEAAHALAAMPVAATLGLGSIRCECLTALVLNLHGNAITLSQDLWKAGIRNAALLREEIVRLRHQKVFTFGAVSPVSSHFYLLRKWLAEGGINADRDVRIVIVPPPQMVANLKAGHLDGFCAGEPWNSVAIQSGLGWCPGVSAELEPGHPEKVLMVRRDFAANRAEEHIALIAALLDACAWCDAPENRADLISILSRREYVDASPEALQCGFDGRFPLGNGQMRTIPNFSVFHRHNSNEPSAEKTAWVFELIRRTGFCRTPGALNAALGRRVFCPAIFDEAVTLRSSTLTSHENETHSETEVLHA
jgi:ABC-type nitrate/sulfonate/bicarbonate transport system substrate-binding protein